MIIIFIIIFYYFYYCFYSIFNSNCIASKYSPLILDLKNTYSDFKFINLSMNTLGLMGKSSESLLIMLDDLKLDKNAQKHIIRKNHEHSVVTIYLGLILACWTFDYFVLNFLFLFLTIWYC